jgi:hypothetical protein
VALGQVSDPVLRFSPVSIVPPMLQVYIHLHVAVTRRTNRKTSDKQCACGNQRALDIKVLSLGPEGGNHMLTGAELCSEVCRH